MRNIKWIGIFAIVVSVAFVVWAATFQGEAQASPASTGYTCNANTIAGTYVYAAFGTIDPGNPLGLPPGPYNAAATSQLFGDGTFELTSKTMYNGAPGVVTEHFTGTFSIAENCGVTFYNQGFPTVFTYGTTGHISVMGVSLIPGTHTTYLITRK